MTIVIIVSSSKTMKTIRTMISNKEMLTTVIIVSISDIMFMIIIVTVFRSREAIDDNEDNDWK